MLKVDLAQLSRAGRLTVEEEIAPDHVMWEGSGIALNSPVSVRLSVQRAGEDVLVRGDVSGSLDLHCRRCLERVSVSVDEPLSVTYRRGLDPVEAEREEVYSISERAKEIDLADAIREHLLLAVPQFVICREACRGLCPHCGTDLNKGTCRCEVVETDDRWGPLRDLMGD